MNIQIDAAQAANLAVWAVFITDLLKRIFPCIAGAWVQLVAFGVALVLAIVNIYAAETVPTGHDLTRALIAATATAGMAVFGGKMREIVDRRDNGGPPPADTGQLTPNTEGDSKP